MNWINLTALLVSIPISVCLLWFLTRETTVKEPCKPSSPPVGGGDKATAGKSAEGKPEVKPHHPEHSDDDHPPTIVGLIQTGLVLAVLASLTVVCFRSCERQAEHAAVAKAIDRESAADPDKWFWELWKVGPDGRMHKLATGITRETSKIDGRVTLSWRSDSLNGQITANCIPGQKGFWEVIDGQGKFIKKDFRIYTVSNTEIRGHIDGSEEKYDFVFRRAIRKWN